MNAHTTITLTPCDSHKSFYGKAKVEEYLMAGGITISVLRSYSTAVAAVVRSGEWLRVFRMWAGYSATTGRHLASFFATEGLPWHGKAEWMKVEVVPFSDVEAYATDFVKKSA